MKIIIIDAYYDDNGKINIEKLVMHTDGLREWYFNNKYYSKKEHNKIIKK